MDSTSLRQLFSLSSLMGITENRKSPDEYLIAPIGKVYKFVNHPYVSFIQGVELFLLKLLNSLNCSETSLLSRTIFDHPHYSSLFNISLSNVLTSGIITTSWLYP